MSIVQKILGPVLKKPLDGFGNVMKKTSIRFQYESALASYGLILISLLVMTGRFIFIFFTTYDWWQAFYAVNTIAGIFIMYSQMVGTFMSYLQVIIAIEAGKHLDIDNMKGGIEDGSR